MKRKLIKQGGGGGVTIYLPKKWVIERNLKPGEEVEVEQIEKHLRISTRPYKKEKKKISVSIGKQDRSRIRTLIASAYRRGFDQVTLNSTEGFSFVEINEVVDSLIGFVISEQSAKRVVIENVMADKFERVSSIINKFFLTIKFLNTELINFLLSKESDTSELRELDKSIIKLRDYCQRMIHMTTYNDDRCYDYYNLIFVTEKYAGNLKNFRRLKKTININKVLPQLKENQDFFVELYKALMKKDIDKALLLNKKASAIKKRIYSDPKSHPLLGLMATNLFSLSSRIVGVLI
ncbi:AbrB/MazE/SpoVT family DNA-binding domain-containing protein [Patescibacteria group bacterium]|nr:AbrB/MazE/SpoVT family DNA-binding domain-containing protein [Patescibacteria group bacterium]MBU1622590.1 AbrB/MazE/SpoVT family DNA-binding domain-containing protein [Nanoarchaeota archaeon]